MIKQISFHTFGISPCGNLISNETYEGIIIEAERFHHNLNLHFGALADDCDTEEKRLNFDLYD